MVAEKLGGRNINTRRHGTYVGIVKKNDDPQHMGRCSVWIPDFGGDPAIETNWYVISYAAPFGGSTPVNNNRKGAADQTSSQTSYGFWMQAPDVDNQVLVTFANGDLSCGYWFACIYQQNMNHSVPGIASNVSTDQSLTDQGIYPPTVEYNKRSDENPNTPKRPTFEPLHNGLSNQGLYTDAERGRSSTGARRESPSKAFGYSTPRGTQMGVDDNPENEMIRLRTRGGTQVLVHETSGYVYINSKNGNSWIEISDEGIDIYSKKSISIRAEEDLNFRADRDVNIEGERGVFLRSGKALTIESGQNTHVKAGTDIKLGAGGVFQTKSGGAINLDASGALTMKAGGNMLRTASQLHDNGPAATSVSMPEVKAVGERTSTQPQVTSEEATKTTETMADSALAATTATTNLSDTSKMASQALTGATSSASNPATISSANALLAQSTRLTEATANIGAKVAQVQAKVAGVSQQLTGAISSATAQARSVVGTVAGTVQNRVAGTIGNIGGNLGGALANKVNAAVNGATGLATGELGSIVGQAGSALGQVDAIRSNMMNSTAMSTISQVQGIAASGLGAMNSARASLANVLTEAQQVGAQLQSVAANATSVAGQMTVLSAATDLPLPVKDDLVAKAADLTASGQVAAAAGTTLKTAAAAAQSKMAPEAAIPTITTRLPSHEPWSWHVKDGQQSIAPVSRDDMIASAGSRGGMSAISGTLGVADLTQKISTGSGDILRKVAVVASPMVQVGGNLIPSNVLSAVREAASITKLDAGYLMAKAAEMNFNPLATLGGSTGVMQITQSTFSDMVSRYGAQFGIGHGDIGLPRANAVIGALMTKENSVYLEDKGLPSGATELNMAHLMGPPVASQFLTNLERNPLASAFASVPESFSRDNRSIFYGTNGEAKSLQTVYDTFASQIFGKATAFSQQIDTVRAATKPIVGEFPPGYFL